MTQFVRPSSTLSGYLFIYPLFFYRDPFLSALFSAIRSVALRVLVDLLRRDRSPGGPRRPSVGALLDPGLQRQLTNFNLLTHNFGNPAVLATLETMRAVVLSAEENLGASAMPGGADLKKEKAEKKAQEKE